MKHCKKLFALLAAALLCMALTLPAGAAAPLVRDECGIFDADTLADLEEDEVGDIHNIVHRVKSDSEKLLLEPFRRRTHFHVLNGNSFILRSSVSIQNFYRDSTFALSFLEC